jgi:hypothetical protein
MMGRTYDSTMPEDHYKAELSDLRYKIEQLNRKIVILKEYYRNEIIKAKDVVESTKEILANFKMITERKLPNDHIL